MGAKKPSHEPSRASLHSHDIRTKHATRTHDMILR